MQSFWKDREITVDGNKKDWEGSLKYFEDEKAAISISNDSNYIYFCLATSDRSKIMKIMSTGLTVWLDPQDSDGKTIGIQYPIKRERAEFGELPIRDKNKPDNENDRFKNMIEKFKVEQNEVLIMNEDKFPMNVYPLKNQTGLEVGINFEMNQLVYELKVPISNNNIINVDVLPNENLKVGFETGEFEKPENGKGNGMRAEGGMPGGDEMSGGRRGGGMKGGNRPEKSNMSERMNPIEFWINVKLAAK